MDTIIYVTFSQVAVASLLVLTRKGRHGYNTYLRYFMFFGICHLIIKVLVTGFVDDPFIAQKYFAPFSFGYTPALYLYVREVYFQSYTSRKWVFFHFLPLILALTIYLAFAIVYSRSGIHPVMVDYSVYGYYCLGIQFVIYPVLSLRLSWKGIMNGHSAVYVLRYTAAISTFLLLLGGMIILDMIDSRLLDYTLAATVAYLSLLGIFVLIVWMQFNQRVEVIITETDHIAETKVIRLEKYKSSGLSDVDKEKILSRIQEHFQRTKPYLNSEFNMQTLVSDLEIPKHHISQVLNEQLGKNFFQVVNMYRVEAVCELFEISGEELPNLMQVAYECGFKSKSTFNSNFKRIKGVTPSQYFDRNLKN